MPFPGGYNAEEPIDPLLDDTIKDLWILARGDFDLVEEAVMSSLEKKGHLFWERWEVNIPEAIKYITRRREELENIKPQDDVTDI